MPLRTARAVSPVYHAMQDSARRFRNPALEPVTHGEPDELHHFHRVARPSKPATENYPIVVVYLHATWKPVTEAGDHC